MKMHILVIADIEDDDTLSLDKAHDIILPLNATVEIVKFIQHCPESELSLGSVIEQAEQSLFSVIHQRFNDSSDVAGKIVVSDNIAEWVVEYCDKNSIDLVIKGGHRSESLFHTPSDWTLLRHLSCPMLIASHAKWKSNPNILMALDLVDREVHQQLNALTLRWGDSWSKATVSELHAMYSIPIAKPLLEFDVVDPYLIEQKKGPAAKKKMDSLLARNDMNSVISHIVTGPPDRTIPHLANELHSDLVIMGCVGREGVSGFLFGNTAEKVIHHLRTDCLVIKLRGS